MMMMIFLIGFDKPAVHEHSTLSTSGYGNVSTAFTSSKAKQSILGGDESAEAEPKIIVYCKLGGRATTAATVLSEMGFQNVYCYKGSASEWWSK